MKTTDTRPLSPKEIMEVMDLLKDDEIESLNAYGQGLLQDRDEKRKEEAIADAIARLAAAVLEPKDLIGKGAARRKRNGVAGYKAGHTYQHPDDPSKVWKGTGVRPGWVKDLEAKGKKPNELANPGSSGNGMNSI